MATYQLIGAEVSLYTGKLRCYLNYKNIPYEEIVASKEVYRDIIIPRTGVRYIPVLITDDNVALQDTTVIIDALESRYPSPSVYPGGPLQKLVALLLETYADEWLVIPAMYYRWSIAENREFAIREFGRTSAPGATPEEQSAIGQETAKPFAGALPRLGISADNGAAIETSFLALLADLERHFARYPFLLGERPSIGDLGLIGPLYAHLYRDPYSGRLLTEKAPRVAAWVQRMIDSGVHQHSIDGDFLSEDQVPDTLLPIIARMFREQGSVLLQTMAQLQHWAEDHPDIRVPRAIGECTFTIEGVGATRLTFPYMQWMWQRCVDAYQPLEDSDKQRVDTFLESVPGALELLNTPIGRRLGRENNQVILV